MQFVTIKPTEEFPHDFLSGSTDVLKDVSNLIADAARAAGAPNIRRSASGHAYYRTGVYASVSWGDEPRVTVVVRPSRIEIVAIERVEEDGHSRAVRCAKALVRQGVHVLHEPVLILVGKRVRTEKLFRVYPSFADVPVPGKGSDNGTVSGG